MHRVRHEKCGIAVAEPHAAVVAADQDAAVDELAHELLQEEGVPVCALDHQPTDVVGKDAGKHPVEEKRGVLSRQRIEPEHRGVPPRRAPCGTNVEDLRAGGGHEHHRGTNVGREALEKVEEVGLGPVDVLDEENGRAVGCDLLDELDRRCVQTLARIERVYAGRDVEAEREREDLALAEPRGHLLRGGALGQPVVLADDLAERPVGDPGAVCEAAPGAGDGCRSLVFEHRPELVHQT